MVEAIAEPETHTETLSTTQDFSRTAVHRAKPRAAPNFYNRIHGLRGPWPGCAADLASAQVTTQIGLRADHPNREEIELGSRDRLPSRCDLERWQLECDGRVDEYVQARPARRLTPPRGIFRDRRSE